MYDNNQFHRSNCNYFKDPISMTFEDSGYHKFENRLETFINWPSEKEPKPFELAVFGFLVDPSGTVKCFSCNGTVDDWSQDDKPDEVHAACFPKCDFISNIKGCTYITAIQRKQYYHQTPLDSLNSEGHRCREIEFPGTQKLYEKSCGLDFLGHLDHAENKQKQKQKQQPIYPDYETKESRQKSFIKCDRLFKIVWLECFIEAGFFSLNGLRCVRCFSCGMEINKFDNISIDPMIMHSNLRSKCDYMNRKEIKDIIKKNQINQEGSQSSIVAREAISMPYQQSLHKMNKSDDRIYASFKNRRYTLANWNSLILFQTNEKLDEMAREGLFYSINSYACGIYCFHCENRVDGWRYADDMAKEHTYLYPDCGWIKYRNSSEYIFSEKDVEAKKQWTIRVSNFHFATFDNRAETFLYQWPSVSQAPPSESVAEAGLYFFSKPDTVCCFACNVMISGWKPNDIPIFIHLTERSTCTFIKTPIGQNLIKKVNCMPKYRDVVMQENQPALSSTASGNTEEIPTLCVQPEERDPNPAHSACYPAYVTFNARNASFQLPKWPCENVAGLDSISMAKAGFFCNNRSWRKNSVRCFQCGIEFHTWKSGDRPSVEHEKSGLNCPFAKKHLQEIRNTWRLLYDQEIRSASINAALISNQDWLWSTEDAIDLERDEESQNN